VLSYLQLTLHQQIGRVFIIKIPHTLSEFKQTYYYKTDLIKLCRQWNLPTSGTKAELNSYIEKYLKGMSANEIKPCRSNRIHCSLTYNEINLNTKLINSGFCFNKVARRWFADYFGVDKFSFSKPMAIIKRQAEAEQNTDITVGDLISQV
jgi:hypothetical protein